MAAPETLREHLDQFVAPFVGQPAWGARQGHGSFLTLEFGAPELIVKERHSAKDGLRRQAYVRGRWHVWIYCCQWRFTQHGKQIAWSESSREDIGRATAWLEGQNLLRVSVDPPSGKSLFAFDLGGLLETWPVGDDPTVEQWYIFGPDDVFAYRADGRWCRQPADTPRDQEQWHCD